MIVEPELTELLAQLLARGVCGVMPRDRALAWNTSPDSVVIVRLRGHYYEATKYNRKHTARRVLGYHDRVFETSRGQLARTDGKIYLNGGW